MNTEATQSEWKKRDYAYLGVLLCVYGVYNLILLRRFFPITEGWFQDYANYINAGEIPYRDFNLFIPPVFPYLMVLIGKLSGNVFVTFRFYGLIEGLTLIGIVFGLLKRVLPSEALVISLLTASIVYTANHQYILYGYYQTSLLLAVVMLWFAVKLYEKYDGQWLKYSIAYGAAASLATLCKHSTGVILFVALTAALSIVTSQRGAKKFLKVAGVAAGTFCCTTFILLVPFMIANAFIPMLDQLFRGASSKGSLLTVLFGFFSRIVNADVAVYLAVVGIVAGMNLLHDVLIGKRFPQSAWRYVAGATDGLLVVVLGLLVKQLIVDARVHELYAAYPRVFILQLVALGTSVLVYCLLPLLSRRLKLGGHYLARRNYVAAAVVTTALTGAALASIFAFVARNDLTYMAWEPMRSLRLNMCYAVFFIGAAVVALLVLNTLVRKDHRNDVLLLLWVAAECIMYVHGMSAIIEEHSMLLSMSLLVGATLVWLRGRNVVKNVLVYTGCLILMLAVLVQKTRYIYHWWGVNLIGDVYSAQKTYTDPHLAGLYGNEAAVNGLNAVYDLIEEHKREGDTMYTFPHITYFNVMADLKSPTFAKVHYFDVCSDEVAVSDAQVLLEQKPTFLVWMDMPPHTWTFHEDVFRAGNRSGQRAIAEAYSQLTSSGAYNRIFSGSIDRSDGISIWELKNRQ